MIRVVTAVGGQIERDGEALLAGGDVAAIKGVAFLRGREARILAHGPRARDKHGAVGAAQVGRQTGHGVEARAALEIGRGVEGLEIELLERLEGAFLQ